MINTKIYKNKYLLSAFNSFYNDLLCMSEDLSACDGDILELGSGYGFIKHIKQKIITSDIEFKNNIDVIFDATKTPFPDNTFTSIYAINVLHHIKDPILFLDEIYRILNYKGICIFVEPHNGFMSKLIHKIIHKNEIFDINQINWRNDNIISPMFGANQALSHIIFTRDIDIFNCHYNNKFKIIKKKYASNFIRYIISGGISFFQLLPNYFLPFIIKIEKLLIKYLSILSLYEYTVLMKVEKNSNNEVK
jgi:SAM-dependent methyltransferase